jgi:Tol biopolymer transport system component
VAIKVLPQHLAATAEVRARFEREARTISQLNHPHICTLYDVGQHDGVDYLVMELIAGETLAHRLARGPLAAAEALSLGRQIADALDAAHRAGVIHRDLKPGNVMLTRSGAKLMDFGLARATGLADGSAGGSASPTLMHSPTVAAPLTAEGTIVGTFQYMAPEQLEGGEADARSDIWALGCVLYEIATGVRAFEGQSQASLIAAIMTREPRPITELRPMTPLALEKIVVRCLQKDPDARWQSARDLAFALALVAGGDLETTGAVPRPARPRRAASWIRAAAALLIAALAFVAGRMMAPPSSPGSIRVSTLSQGTRDVDPAVSPDGRWIAFNAVRQNGQGLWLMDMVTRSEVKLTSDADNLPRFTADGGSVLFTRTKNGRRSLWRIPVIGGAPRLLLEDAADVDTSPDGDRIAYISAATGGAGARAQLMVARSDGTGSRELWSRGSAALISPRWSPDGKRISVGTTGNQNTPNAVVVVDVSNGSSRDYPAPNGAVLSNAAWDGTGKGLVVAEGVGITALQRGSSGRLFRLDTRSGEYQPLGWLENFPSTIALLPDGRLVLSSLLVRQSLREVSIDANNLVDGRWLTSGMSIDRQPVYSPDGRAVMFSSNRGGALDLWEVSVETGELHRVTDDPADDWDPEYGPDGESIYWCSRRSGAFEIWTARRDGSAARQLSRDSLDAENPSIAPDNRWVIYSSANQNKSGLWKVPVAGGDAEFLLRSGTLIPDLSPDGRYVSVIADVGTIEPKLSVFDLSTKTLLPASVPLQVFPGTVQVGRARFTPDGNAVVFIQVRSDGHPILVRRPLSAWSTGAGTAEVLFPGASDAIETFDFSPDGKRAVVSVVDWLSGLSIAEGVQGIIPPKPAK